MYGFYFLQEYKTRFLQGLNILTSNARCRISPHFSDFKIFFCLSRLFTKINTTNQAKSFVGFNLIHTFRAFEDRKIFLNIHHCVGINFKKTEAGSAVT